MLNSDSCAFVPFVAKSWAECVTRILVLRRSGPSVTLSRMVTVDTVEGRIDGDRISWHYDVFAAVMYVRLEADRDTPAVGDFDDHGVIHRRDEATGRLIGRTALGRRRLAERPGEADSLSGLARWAVALAVGL